MEALIDRESLGRHLDRLVGDCRVEGIEPLGRGAHGTGYLVRLRTELGEREFVMKGIDAGAGLGHDYASDRAAMHLLALETFGGLPGHVRAIDVISVNGRGEVSGMSGGQEYFLLMQRGHGVPYFDDLHAMAEWDRLDGAGRTKVRVLVEYLAAMHSRKKDSRALYLRKLRDTIGHGECLMGVFDTYPDGILAVDKMARIEKKCIDWRARLKGNHRRLCAVHGDFHPGNLWFPPMGEEAGGGTNYDEASLRAGLCLLDRSRGPWGEAADDVTALTINYVFFGILKRGGLSGAYREAFELFFDLYLSLTGDAELLEVAAPFYAFRGAVVANPVFYPEVTPAQRAMIFAFVHRVLDAPRFDPRAAAGYVIERAAETP